MPIQWQTIDIPLGAGLSDGIDPKLVQPGQNIDVVDMYQDRQGELRKRNGYSAITRDILTGGTISAGKELISDGSNLLVADGTNIHAYAEANAKWLLEGAHTQFNISSKVISAEAGTLHHHLLGAATVSNQTLIAYFSVPDNLVVGKVIDATTGNELVVPFGIAGGSEAKPYIFPLPGAATPVIGIVRESGDELHYYTYTPSTRVYALVGAITTDYHSADGIGFAACSYGTANFLVAYKNDVAPVGERINIRKFDEAGSSLGLVADQVSAGNVIYSIAVAEDFANGQIIATAYTADEVLTAYRIIYSTLFALDKEVLENTYAATPDHFSVGIVQDPNSNAAYVLASHAPAIALAPTPYGKGFRSELRTYKFETGGGSSQLTTFWNGILHSIPFNYGTKTYVFVGVIDMSATPTAGSETADVAPESALYLCDVSGNIFGRFLVGELNHPKGISFRNTTGDIITSNPDMPPPVIDVGSGVFKLHTSRDLGVEAESAYSNESLAQVLEVTLDLNPSVPQTKTISQNMVFLPHKGVSQYDGTNVRIAGFYYYPATISAVIAAGGSIDIGSISIVVVFEWKDEKGNIYRSAPSRPETVTTAGGNQKITVLHPKPGFGLVTENTRSYVKIFRTLANGSVYYLAYTTLYTAALGSGSWASVNLLAADSTIDQNETLYTTGGVLANISPPTPSYLASDAEHMYAVPALDRTRIWESKPLNRLTGVDFTDALILNVLEGGDITGIAFLDGTKIIFKSRQIRYFSGSGHDALGLGGFSQDKLLIDGLGCDEPRSIVKTPIGIIFKSQRGFYLIGRDLRPQYIGDPVESYNAETVLNATVIEEQQQIRFLTTYPLEPYARILVFDYQKKYWVVFTTADPVNLIQIIDATLWKGAYVQLSSVGKVYKEDFSLYADDAGNITPSLETPWIKVSGLAGYQRIRRFAILGEYRAAFTMDVEVFYDYNPAVAQTIAAITTTGTPAAGDPFCYRIRPTNQKCKAIKFALTIKSNTTEGLRLTALSLEVGVKGGLDRLGASQSE